MKLNEIDMWKKLGLFVLGITFFSSCSSDDGGDDFQITASYFQNILVNTDTKISVLIAPVSNSVDSVYYYSYKLNGVGKVKIDNGDALSPGDVYQTKRLTSSFIFRPTALGANFLTLYVRNNDTEREFEIFYDVIAK